MSASQEEGLAEFKSVRRRLIDAIRRSRARSSESSEHPSESTTAKPFEVPDDMIMREAIGAAIDALHLELKFIVGGVPEEHEWKSWVMGFGDGDQRMRDIVQRRNPWAAKFSDRYPDFWRDLRRQIGI
jgi:hypothetical protein